MSVLTSQTSQGKISVNVSPNAKIAVADVGVNEVDMSRTEKMSPDESSMHSDVLTSTSGSNNSSSVISHLHYHSYFQLEDFLEALHEEHGHVATLHM